MNDDGIPRELHEMYDDAVDDALALVDGGLSAEAEAAIRERMARDPYWAKAVEGILAAFQAPPVSERELRKGWLKLKKRLGLK